MNLYLDQIGIYCFLILISAVIGSFFNMLIYRLPLGLDIVFKPSHCPKCEHPLNILDLIPILSFLLLGGKCRYCQNKIPIRYFLVELCTVIFTLVFYQQDGISLNFFQNLIFFYSLIIIFFTDLETQIIPDFLNYSLISLGFIFALNQKTIFESTLGFLLALVIFLIIIFVGKFLYKKDVMGFGDLKLALAIGAYWGWKFSLISFYLSFIIGGLGGLILILLKFKKKTDLIPFGPFIVLSVVITKFFFPELWRFVFG